MNATKAKLGRAEALELASKASKLYVAKGKKVVELNLTKERPDDDELCKLMLGPTGNLRAPTLRKGKSLIVGFNDEMYTELFS